MTHMTRTGLSTSLDVFIEVAPRSGGIESGRFHGEWVDCPFTIAPASNPTRGFQRGFDWSITFRRTDSGYEPDKTFAGVADTRAIAKANVREAITKYIFAVVQTRIEESRRKKIVEDLSVAAGVPLAR